MRNVRLLLTLLVALFVVRPAFADTVPTLNDILNASQIDVRASAVLPSTANAEVVEVRADSPLRQTFRTGTNVTRLDKIAICFSGWSESWTREKSLVMRLYAGQDFTRVIVQVEEPYTQRLWEGAVHVFTLNIPVAQNAEYTFELTTYGGRSLTGAALAQPPLAAAVGPLTSNGETLPGALWFETSVKRRSDLDKLYLDVFSHFDLQRPELRGVQQAVATRDWDRAKRALVAHFESRRDLFPAGTAQSARPEDVPEAKLADAELAVDHKVRSVDEIVDLGPRWNHLTTWRSRGGVGLTRSGLRGILATAYARTQDERYAEAWDEMLRFEFADLPSPLRSGAIPPDARNIPPTVEPGIAGGSMWASLSLAARMSHGFTYYRAFRESPSFSPDTRFAFIANLAEMSDVLERMKGGGNWEAQNATSLLEFGRKYPEFRKAGAWTSNGFGGALQNCLDNTFSDGPLREAAMNYHILSLNRYLGVLETARKQPGLAVPSIVRNRVEKMCDYLLFSTMPNNRLPTRGDSNPPTEAAALLLRGAELFARPDMRWVATSGRQGLAPQAASRAFPDAGYYIMRSGWSANAAFFALHNGVSSAHGHNDANSFVLTAFGNDLLIDPGVYIYGTAESQLLTRTVSHNTVTMDDRSTLNDTGAAQWTTGWWTDIYDGVNAGYTIRNRSDDKPRHRRIVVFLKPSVFFVVDGATSSAPHDWTLRYHFAPGRLDAAGDGKSVTFSPVSDPAYPVRGNGGLRLWSAAPDTAHLTTVQGLASGGWERKIEAPVALWSQFQTGTANWATLLEPFASAPSPAKWDVRQNEQGTAMALQKAAGGSRFILVRTDPEAPFPDEWARSSGYATDAQVATYEDRPARQGAPGLRRLTLHTATLFTTGPSRATFLVHAEQPMSLLEADWQRDTLTIHRVGGAGIVVRTLGSRWLILNGRKTAIPPGQATTRLLDPPQ